MILSIFRQRLLTSLIFVFFACGFLALGWSGMSNAASQATDASGSAAITSSENLLPENAAKIKFVRGGSLRSAISDDGSRSALSNARPLTLASGDLNADGFPDLVCGYQTPRGGLIVIHFGDPQAFAPTNPADIQATIENRFRTPFGESSLIELDHAPDFLALGDFDRDNRRDIITAAKGGLSINVLLKTDEGFSSNELQLPGELTTMAVSETYSPDGYADVYAAIVGGRLLAFEQPESVLEQKPGVYSLPGSADAMTVGRFDDGTNADFAVVVAGHVYIVHGGQRSTTELIDLPFAVTSVTAGDFIWDRDSRMELAVAAADGSTSILSRGELDTRRLTSDEVNGRRQIVADIRDGKRPASALANRSSATRGPWIIAEQPSARAGISGAGSPTLLPILVSGQQSVDLLTFDPGASALSVSYRRDGLTMDPNSARRESVSFPVDAAPVAVIAMRLNVHSQSSLVVFEQGQIEPNLIFFAPEAVITVTSAADVLDAAAGNCAATTIASLPGPNGVISLREAVCAANNTAGADSISFAAGLNGVPIQLTRVGDDNTSSNGDLDINTDITFTGNGAANTIIQGSSSATFTGNMGDKAFGINQAGLLTAQSVAFSNMTIRFTRNDIAVNGAFTQTGGAMDIFLTGTGANPGPTTSLTNVTFDSNASLHSYGGALNVDSGSLTPPTTNVFRGTVQITGSTFSNNDTLNTSLADNPPTGGAINLFADIDAVTISSSSITANQTSADVRANGGGINMRHSNGGTITINSNTAITNNISGSDGGGFLTAFNQTISITGGSITGNTAQGTGDSANGGGFVHGNNVGTTTLSSVTISNNIATAGTAGTGGGVSDGANTALALNNCTITGNSADNGGGVAVTASGATQTMTIANSTSFTGNTATTGSAAYVSGGIAALSGTNTIAGNIEVATGTLNALAASTTNLTGNLNMSAGTINGNSAAFNITGNYSQSGGTFNGGTSTFAVTGSFSESGGTFNNTTNTFGVGAGSTLSAGIFNAAGAFNVTGNHLQSGGTYNGGGTMTLIGTGNFTQSNGTFTGNAVTVNLLGNFSYTGGTFTGGTSTFNFNGSGAQSVSNSSLITFSNLSDANVTQPLTFNNSVNFSGSLTANGANTILNPVATAVLGGTGTLTGTGTARVTRATGTNDFLLQYSIANKTLTNLLIDYVGAAAQGISGTTYSNIRLNNGNGGTLNAPAIVNGTLTLANGVFNVGTSTLTLNNGVSVTGGSLTSGATGTVIYNQSSNGQQVIAGTYGNLTFSNFTKVLPSTGTVSIAGTFTPGTAVGHTITGSTVIFNGAAAQTLPSAFTTYNNLTLNNPTTVLGFAGLTVQGLLRVQAGTFTSNSGTYSNVQVDAGATLAGTNATAMNVSGNWLNNGTFTANGNTVSFNGSSLQTISGGSPMTFSNLTVNNAAGISLALNATVNGVLTLTNGEVGTAGANILMLGTTGTVTRTAGIVTGTLRKNFAAAGPAFTMPVGTAGAYSPLFVTVTSGAGQLTAKANTGVPAVLIPNTARTLQRFWTLSGSGIRSDITFNYLDGDVPGPPNNENIWNIIRVTGTVAVRYPPTLPYVTMNPAGNQFSIAGLESYSDWTAGEPLAPTAANANVSGRVAEADGRPVPGALVAMQSQEGEVRFARTNPFGYYKFDDVQAGQTYLVSVTHKRFSFTTRTVTVSDDVTGFDFTPESEVRQTGDRSP